MDPIRRTILSSGIFAVSVALTGCLDGSSDGGGQSPEIPSPVEHDIMKFAATFGVPDWADPDDSASGHLAVFTSVTPTMESLNFNEIDDDRKSTVKGFIEGTDFETEFLLYVASEGPNSNYRDVEITQLVAEDGVIVGSAKIRSAEETGADEAPMYSSVLVRVTADDGWPERVEMTIVDGWDRERSVEVTP